MRTHINRLHRVTRDEVTWRMTAAARTAAQRLDVRLREPRWDRRDVRHALTEDIVDEAVGAAIAQEDWLAVHEALALRIRARDARFVLDPDSAKALRDAVCARQPSAALLAAEHADRILTGRYDVLGYRGLVFAPDGPAVNRTEGVANPSRDEVDWHFDPVHNRRAPRTFWADVPYLDPGIGDHKIIWELNRHQHWLQLGRALWLTRDPQYGHAILDRLESWLAANPPLVGINWASMLEIGFRTLSWTWALHFLLADIGHEGHEDGATKGTKQHESATKGTKHPDQDLRDLRDLRGQDLRDLRDLRGQDLRDLRGQSSSSPSWPWLVDMLVAIDRQLSHVEQNLSYYFSPNTHLTGEALALYVVGLALPELRASRRWVETGRRILLTEIDRQVHADGGHAERSTHYQRYTLDFYLLALLTSERVRDREATAQFRDAVTRLAEFTRAMADDRGQMPLIGDDDGGALWPIAGRQCDDVRDSLALAALVLDRPELAPWGCPEEVFWLAGRQAVERSPFIEEQPGRTVSARSRALPETGYFVARDGRGGHAIFDAGAHGYLNGGHAHADALAVTLALANRQLLIDPGTSTYTMDLRLRDRMRSSMSHNTVTIDDRSQASPAGPFHWRTRAEGRLHAWRHNAAFDWAEGSHDGYAPLRHTRAVLRTTDAGWLLVDDIAGDGHHAAAAHWHLDPAWMLMCDAPGRLRATHMEGDAAWLLYDSGDVWLAHGDDETGLGWHAPTYGTLVPTWTARITRHGTAPFAMVTWIDAVSRGSDLSPALERLTTACEVGGRAVAARVAAGRRASIFMLRLDEAPSRETRACGIEQYQTNARVLRYTEEAGHLLVLDLIDASHALALRGGWISVAANGPMTDLHIALRDDVLELCASEPPSQLRIQGSPLRRMRAVRANERELTAAADRTDTLIVEGGDWGEDPRRGPVRAAGRSTLAAFVLPA